MYNAIMRTAGLLEDHPALWDFMNSDIPECGTPGCALGLIAAECGERGNVGVFCMHRMGVQMGEFLERMSEISRSEFPNECCWNGVGDKSARLAAACLRLYAEKYHAKPKVKTGTHPFVQKLLEHQPEILSTV